MELPAYIKLQPQLVDTAEHPPLLMTPAAHRGAGAAAGCFVCPHKERQAFQSAQQLHGPKPLLVLFLSSLLLIRKPLQGQTEQVRRLLHCQPADPACQIALLLARAAGSQSCLGCPLRCHGVVARLLLTSAWLGHPHMNLRLGGNSIGSQSLLCRCSLASLPSECQTKSWDPDISFEARRLS